MLGAIVDAHGCALDSDLDGVPDGLDRCPNSAYGEKVDATGCEPGTLLPPLAKMPVLPKRVIASKPPAAAKPAARSEPARLTEPNDKAVSSSADAPPPAESPLSQAPPPTPVEVPVVRAPTAIEIQLPPKPAERPTAPPAPVPEPRSRAEMPVAAEPAQAPAVAPPAKPHSGPLIVETLGMVRFARNSAALSENETQRLQRLVDDLKPRLAQLPGSGLYLTGYLQPGDAGGLDQRRAEAVRGVLIAKGLPAAQLRLAEIAGAPRKDSSGQTVVIQLLPF
jgi:hypothetical protein